MNNNSETFRQIEYFKQALPCLYADFDSVLNYRYNIIKNNFKTVSYTQALRNLMGIYPADLVAFLSSLKEDSSTFINFSDISKIQQHNSLWEKDFSIPAQLANYEWRYTDKSAKQIVQHISKYKQIGCLGTPSIALELIYINKASNITLFDINKPLITKVKEKYSMTHGINCVEYDVIDEIPELYKNSFDVVSINPPWYYDYYKLFIIRALQMLNNAHKDIIIPLFPLLSKRNAIKELVQLFEFLGSIGCYNIESLGYVEFEMPLFEKKALEEKGIPIPDANWRNAELVKLSFNNTEIENNSLPIDIHDHIKWESKITKSNKLFLINENCINNSLVNSNFKKEKILDISRKSIETQNIAVWDVANNVVIRLKK